jgi:alpha-2-macroglobulin
MLLGLLVALGLISCNTISGLKTAAPLPFVATLPTPQLPDWIEQISPTGAATPLTQIRIRFKDPLIPVENLENPAQQQILKQFELTPALPGQFRFLTPRMVGFQADQAIPKATRVRVTLKAGLADLNQHRLSQDLAWTFNTEAIKLTDLPGTKREWEREAKPISLKPTLSFTANQELDLGSLQEQVALLPPGQQQGVPLTVALKENKASQEDESETPREQFDPSARNWIYTLTPQQELSKATTYQLKVSPGLRPAQGNLPSETAFSSSVTTYAPLSFQQLEYINPADAGGAYGRFERGSGQLKFNNGLLAESTLKTITIEPKPKDTAPLVRAYDGDNTIDLNPWVLEPNTTYTLTLGADLKDVFGQTLAKPAQVQYTTGNVAPDFWAPSGLNIFPSGKELQLNLSAVNLPEAQYKAAYRVVQPTDLVYTDSAEPQDDGRDLLPKPANWQTFPVKGQPNQPTEITVPLRQELSRPTGLLAYGVQARTNAYRDEGQERWRSPSYYGLVQLTNLGVFAQWFPESGLVRVHHLSDGAAVAKATVEIYESKLEGPPSGTPVPCATGVTDSSGTLQLGLDNLKTCMKGSQGFADPPQLLAIAREGQDWAFVRTLDYSGAYSFGLENAGWDSNKPVSRGTIFSDRQLYKPGETAWFTAAAYFLQNGSLQQDKNARYRVTLEDPNGQAIALGQQTTNDFGSFSVKWDLPANQPLGTYVIKAKRDDDHEIQGDFRVAEFKPPNFKVDLSLNQTLALIDQTVEAQAQSNYLFGPPVEGGKATYYVTRKQTDFTPKGWEAFSFGRRWFWPEESPTVSSDVLQVSGALDATGKSQQAIQVAQDLPYAMTYRVDVEVADVSNLSVANSKTFTALPGDRLIGLKSNFVAEAGKPFSLEAIVTDPSGKPLSGQSVRLELQRMIYSNVTQLIEGSQTPKDQVEFKTVDQLEFRSGDKPQSLTLKPTESGAYRIRANLSDAKDDRTATEVQIWATGPEATFWGDRYRNNRLELKLDKKDYQPGETATVLIQSPYPEAELYLAVVRQNTLYKTITKVKGGAPQVQFEVTPEMLPNAAVEAVLVRQGEPLSQVKPGSLDQLVSIGFAPFQVSLNDKYLTVAERLQSPALQPGASQTIDLTLTDVQGRPVQGELAVMAVNEAVLQLTGYRPPDLVKTVYAEQAISTRFADNRPDVVLEPLSSPVEKGWGFGGGFSAGVGSTRIRTDFKPLAYFNGSVLTDAQGKASVTFSLPDDLTTWRVMAIARDGEMRFGSGEATFITTKPLISNPVLPQFARVGDQFEAGVAVTNNTGQSGNLNLQGTLSAAPSQAQTATPAKALPLQFLHQNQRSATQQLQTPVEKTTQAYRFPVVANQPGTAEVQFATQLGSTSDAFAVPLDVQALAITEQVVETGTTQSRVQIPLNVESQVAPDAGGLDLTLASTLIPELKAPAQQVLDEAQLPFLEPAASQLLIAANLKTLSQRYEQTFTQFDLPQQARQALERLEKLQRPDGGFAAWPGQERSDPFTSPYAARAIAQASKAFANTPGLTALQPDSSLVSRLSAYLGSVLANPGQYDFCKDQTCKSQMRLGALVALNELGDRRTDFLADLYAQRNQLCQVQQFQLARYLAQLPDWQTEATSLSQELQQSLYETGRTATVNFPQGWSWLGSATSTQAQALQLALVRQSPPETVDRLLQGLLTLRRDGTWTTPFNNAEALTALVDCSQQEATPPNFTASAQLAGKTLVSGEFQGDRKPSLSHLVPMAELPKGRQTLTLQKSGQGTLHYLTAYRYRLKGDQPGRLNGLRVSRTVQPANQQQVLEQMGLQRPKQPLTVAAGQVFDIGLEVIADHPVDHVVITDPLPAGFEAIDTSFQTSMPALQAQTDSWQIDFQTIHKDRIVAYGDRLDPGVYSLHYLVRSVTPGTFLYPGAEAHLQQAPEEFGRSASTTLKVQ